ncbi:acid ceramidase-like isoform X4 [Gordionus sp. m RMFG-2023]|uniref:acid ceramidase-like isoform X4 n=1 Tax=Gordionus sp. m RMFG-2023 TaxID=3053472 RepID=UPI0031FE3EEE
MEIIPKFRKKKLQGFKSKSIWYGTTRDEFELRNNWHAKDTCVYHYVRSIETKIHSSFHEGKVEIITYQYTRFRMNYINVQVSFLYPHGPSPSFIFHLMKIHYILSADVLKTTQNEISAYIMIFYFKIKWNSINKTWKISEALKPLTVALDYRRGNVTIYKAVSFVGYLGVLTAMKPGKFSLTVNERFTTDGGGFVGILLWLIGCREMNWLSFFTRDLMANALSFQEAREQLKLAPLIAPVYFIIGGLDKTQANVITRSRMQMVNDRNLSAWHNSSRAPNWYLLETNYDWWKKPFFVDDRRTPAINCLKYTKQTGTINFSTLYDVLSTQPVLNKLTVYSSLMNVKAGTIETYLRECPNPCPPW